MRLCSPLVQNMESQRAAAKLSAEHWEQFFNQSRWVTTLICSWTMKVVHGWLESVFRRSPPLCQKHEESKYVGDGGGLWAVWLLANANANSVQRNVQNNDVVGSEILFDTKL